MEKITELETRIAAVSENKTQSLIVLDAVMSDNLASWQKGNITLLFLLGFQTGSRSVKHQLKGLVNVA